VLQWLRGWRERDDQRLAKRVDPVADIDPLEELIRIVNEAQERDAEDERRVYHLMRAGRPSFFNGGGPIASNECMLCAYVG
jgi:hypothetical protein